MKIYQALLCTVTAAFLAILSFPPAALACACCSEPGTYRISTQKPGTYEFDELKRIRFQTADLFMTEAGEEDIKGISPLGGSYLLDGVFQNKTWKLTFKDDKGKSGTLTLPAPVSMVSFMADIHDGPDGGTGPSLYKEWRFKYKAGSGSGIFQKGIAPATDYFLVFQGRGNACTQAEDFTHWRLEITGKKADYAFYGELKKPA
jgi:hypothetical protein